MELDWEDTVPSTWTEAMEAANRTTSSKPMKNSKADKKVAIQATRSSPTMSSTAGKMAGKKAVKKKGKTVIEKKAKKLTRKPKSKDDCEGTNEWRNPAPKNKTPGAIRLGSDCAGFDTLAVACEDLGVPFHPVFASEINFHMRTIIRQTHSPDVIYKDVAQRDHQHAEAVDFYSAGFPCGPFSMMGNGEGVDSDDGLIIADLMQYVVAKRPKVCLFENVANLTRGKHRPLFLFIRRQCWHQVTQRGIVRNGGVMLFASLLYWIGNCFPS